MSGALIGGWTAIFFRQKKLGASAALSGAMTINGLGYVVVAARTDRTAAALGMPLAAWLGFATVLATAVWRDNAARKA